jgi:hypothetical protein
MGGRRRDERRLSDKWKCLGLQLRGIGFPILPLGFIVLSQSFSTCLIIFFPSPSFLFALLRIRIGSGNLTILATLAVQSSRKTLALQQHQKMLSLRRAFGHV